MIFIIYWIILNFLKRIQRRGPKIKFLILDANDLYHAMKGLGTDDSILINIMGNRSKEHLQQVQLMYETTHKKTLEHDIRGDTSQNYGKLMRYLLLMPLQLKIAYLRDSMKGKSGD